MDKKNHYHCLCHVCSNYWDYRFFIILWVLMGLLIGGTFMDITSTAMIVSGWVWQYSVPLF